MYFSSPFFPYSFSGLNADLRKMAAQFPHRAKVKILGYSHWKRPVLCLTVGNINSAVHLLIQGAIHGREYLTTRLLAAQACYALEQGDNFSYLFDRACIHWIPMSNPDGVAISQRESFSPQQRQIFQQDWALGFTSQTPGDYARRWKGNAAGIDLNRNFPAGFSQIDSRPHPSSENYKGTFPLSAPESRLLALYTCRYPFCATLSYHETGSVIYWEYGQDSRTLDKCRALAQTISALTGYPLCSQEALPAGGYKDWAIEALKIPSLTIEIGQGSSPLPPEEYPAILHQNLTVPITALAWCLGLTEGNK